MAFPFAAASAAIDAFVAGLVRGGANKPTLAAVASAIARTAIFEDCKDPKVTNETIYSDDCVQSGGPQVLLRCPLHLAFNAHMQIANLIEHDHNNTIAGHVCHNAVDATWAAEDVNGPERTQCSVNTNRVAARERRFQGGAKQWRQKKQQFASKKGVQNDTGVSDELKEKDDEQMNELHVLSEQAVQQSMAIRDENAREEAELMAMRVEEERARTEVATLARGRAGEEAELKAMRKEDERCMLLKHYEYFGEDVMNAFMEWDKEERRRCQVASGAGGWSRVFRQATCLVGQRGRPGAGCLPVLVQSGTICIVCLLYGAKTSSSPPSFMVVIILLRPPSAGLHHDQYPKHRDQRPRSGPSPGQLYHPCIQNTNYTLGGRRP